MAEPASYEEIAGSMSAIAAEAELAPEPMAPEPSAAIVAPEAEGAAAEESVANPPASYEEIAGKMNAIAAETELAAEPPAPEPSSAAIIAPETTGAVVDTSVVPDPSAAQEVVAVAEAVEGAVVAVAESVAPVEVTVEAGVTAEVEAAATAVAATIADGELLAGQPPAKRLKRKQMAGMDSEQLARRAWCLKCKEEGKSRYSWAGSRTDARNGLRKHMKSAHSMTMDQAKAAGFVEP